MSNVVPAATEPLDHVASAFLLNVLNADAVGGGSKVGKSKVGSGTLEVLATWSMNLIPNPLQSNPELFKTTSRTKYSVDPLDD
jgi:hypothetical protein